MVARWSQTGLYACVTGILFTLPHLQQSPWLLHFENGRQVSVTCTVIACLQSMCKTPLLNSLNTFLVSLWGHSLILGHIELKGKSISTVWCFMMEDYLWCETGKEFSFTITNCSPVITPFKVSSYSSYLEYTFTRDWCYTRSQYLNKIKQQQPICQPQFQRSAVSKS